MKYPIVHPLPKINSINKQSFDIIHQYITYILQKYDKIKVGFVK